ncbi:hypothetical protein ACFOY4_01655 [Actinomadura syzygii]|uniref:Uncharacterized protein n=1 Tax=Actinomadura syzygii TaxID=1427538 RepID=A0A5D0TT89_9ACTN|nr:hypothetical protein [Actinomadura syzygii]TYC08552.1 hypothetical protein FXF65_37285 [Actinomadura syzygii]
MTIRRLPVKANGHILARESDVEVHQVGDQEVLIPRVPHACAVCDTWPELRVTNEAVEAQKPCLYPGGITTEITLSVPSGKMIVTDDLRPIMNYDPTGLADYNTVLGQAQAVKAMAAVGCAYGPVGNTCPGLYRQGADHYIIATPGLDENDDPLLPEDMCLARIITDLWAYSIADFELWKARGGVPEGLCWADTIVDVPAGTYRFMHHTGERGFDRDAAGTVTFANIERIA